MSRLFTKAQSAKRFYNQVLLGSRRRALYRASISTGEPRHTTSCLHTTYRSQRCSIEKIEGYSSVCSIRIHLDHDWGPLAFRCYQPTLVVAQVPLQVGQPIRPHPHLETESCCICMFKTMMGVLMRKLQANFQSL